MEIYQDNCVSRFYLVDVPTSSDVVIFSFPFVFTVTTLPLSVVRWSSGFGSIGHNFPTATFVVSSVYNLSGALNVLLFLFIRADVLLPHNRWLGTAPGQIVPLDNMATLPNGHVEPVPGPLPY